MAGGGHGPGKLVLEEVFTEQGASAPTEEVARRAGVAIGTVFRHFPTKNDLLQRLTSPHHHLHGLRPAARTPSTHRPVLIMRR